MNKEEEKTEEGLEPPKKKIKVVDVGIFDDLPYTLWKKIFHFLCLHDLNSFQISQKKFKKYIDDYKIHSARCSLQLFLHRAEETIRSYGLRYNRQVNFANFSVPVSSRWIAICYLQFQLRCRLQYLKIKKRREIKAFDEGKEK